jgi:hypothetical protein
LAETGFNFTNPDGDRARWDDVIADHRRGTGAARAAQSGGEHDRE